MLSLSTNGNHPPRALTVAKFRPMTSAERWRFGHNIGHSPGLATGWYVVTLAGVVPVSGPYKTKGEALRVAREV